MASNKNAAGACNTHGINDLKYHIHHSTGTGGGNPSGLRAEHEPYPVICFQYQGEPVAAARARVVNRHAYTPKHYADYKKALSGAIRQAFGHLGNAIPTPGSKPRAKWLSAHRFRLVVEVYRSINRGDADNFLKAVQDAIQQAGIIGDDCQLDEVYCRKHIDKQNPRISFVLEPLGGSGHGA